MNTNPLPTIPTSEGSNPGWRRVTSPTNTLIDSLNAKVRRITTSLTGFTRPQVLDTAETEVLAAMKALRELRLIVRQMRAEAKADARRAA